MVTWLMFLTRTRLMMPYQANRLTPQVMKVTTVAFKTGNNIQYPSLVSARTWHLVMATTAPQVAPDHKLAVGVLS